MHGRRTRMPVGAALTLIVPLVVLLARTTWAQVAPDATSPGPFATTSAEYKFPPGVDPEISELQTELWARVYRPTDLSQGPYPLLIFLHGNHATCGHGTNPRIDDNTQYTFYGTCPPTAPIVTPNHAGYTYLADLLASWGYIVVSLNVNRGINAAPGFFGDAGLNLTRGRMVLKHLWRLGEWNRNPGTTPPSLGFDMAGLLDFTHVGLFGHSRGGEGVRAAYNIYRDPGSPWPDRIGPVNFEGIFEIGPVDGQTARTLNADSTAWNVILPMCDGDVFNLQGIKPFDRVLAIRDEGVPSNKGTYAVWGANHNFYNTEWQLSDSDGCVGAGNVSLFNMPVGSPKQRQTSLASVLAFFRGYVATQDPTFTENFDPNFFPPDIVTSVTKVDRGFTESPNSAVTTTFEDFDKRTGTNTYGFANDAVGLSQYVHPTGDDPTKPSVAFHAPGQQAALIQWTAPGGSFQTNWTAPGTGRDISSFTDLDFRISRQCRLNLQQGDTFCQSGPHPLNPVDATDFSVQLVQADGTASDPVHLTDVLDLRGPVGNLFAPSTAVYKPIMMTARFPLFLFENVDLTNIRGVRLTFDQTSTGAIYLANVRLSTGGTDGGARRANGSSSASTDQTSTGSGIPSRDVGSPAVNTLQLRRNPGPGNALGVDAVDFVMNTPAGFPVVDSLYVAVVAGVEVSSICAYEDPTGQGNINTIACSVPADTFSNLPDGGPVSLRQGSVDSPISYEFGNLNKSQLK